MEALKALNGLSGIWVGHKIVDLLLQCGVVHLGLYHHSDVIVKGQLQLLLVQPTLNETRFAFKAREAHVAEVIALVVQRNAGKLLEILRGKHNQ